MPVSWTAYQIKTYSKEQQAGVRCLKYDKSTVGTAMDSEMRLHVDDKALGDWCFDSLIIHLCTYAILNNTHTNTNGHKKIKRSLVETAQRM